jgi:hypothetical protein
MHNVKPVPGDPQGWAEKAVLNELQYRLRNMERAAHCMEMALFLGHPHMATIYEKSMINLFDDLVGLMNRHFIVPAPASVQNVPRETQGEAA